MKTLSFLAFGVICTAIVQSSRFRYTPVNVHDFHLDLPPEQRWTEIVSSYKSSGPLLVRYFNGLVPDYLRPIIEVIAGDVDKYLGDYGREIKGIANAFDVPLGIAVTLNFLYELRRFGPGHPNITKDGRYEPNACTSIVAQDADGKIYHGRNLDWNIPDYLKNLTIQINAYYGSQKVFSASTFVGYVGVFTGMKPGAFSVSLNERALGGNVIANVIEDVLYGTITVTHLVRQVLEQETDYAGAVSRLMHDKITAPAYLITAGINAGQGGVITRDRNAVKAFWCLGDVPQPSKAESWYVLETNYDYWMSPPPTDNRRKYGISMMNEKGRDGAASLDGLWHVLTTWPVLNRYTTYTTLIDPANATMQCFIDYYYRE